MKWMLSLFEPTPRHQDKSRIRREAKKEMNREKMTPSPSESAVDLLTESKPIRIPHDQLNHVEIHRTATEISTIADTQRRRDEALQGMMAQQQQSLSQGQMSAMAHAMQQEASMLLGADPLRGVPTPTTPYWERMYGELGKSGGPYYPKSGK